MHCLDAATIEEKNRIRLTHSLVILIWISCSIFTKAMKMNNPSKMNNLSRYKLSKINCQK